MNIQAGDWVRAWDAIALVTGVPKGASYVEVEVWAEGKLQTRRWQPGDIVEVRKRALRADGDAEIARLKEENDHGAELIHHTIPDVAETEPRLTCGHRSDQGVTEGIVCMREDGHYGDHGASGDGWGASWPQKLGSHGNQVSNGTSGSAQSEAKEESLSSSLADADQAKEIERDNSVGRETEHQPERQSMPSVVTLEWTPDYMAAKDAEAQFLARLRALVYVPDGFNSAYEPDPHRVEAANRIERLRADFETERTMHNAWRKRAEEAESQLAALRTNGDAEIARPTSASEAHARGLPVLGAAGALEQPRPTSRVCFYCKGTVTPANDPFHVHGCNECLCGLEPPHNRDLHEDQAELIAALQEQIDQVYALARGPIEQAKAIPLGQWVKTRFVHIEDFNEQIISREDREKALGAAVAVNVAHVRENHESEKYLTEARRLLKLEDGQ